MKRFGAALITLTGLALAQFATAEDATCAAWLDHSLPKLHSKDVINVCEATAGKPVLIVNTASHCGFTPQFTGLEKLYQRYKDQGLVVIGFPSDDFNHEAKDSAETASICYINHGVTFLMTEAVHVKGDNAYPIFQTLGKEQGAPQWNFNKYLVDKQGRVVQHFPSKVTPESDEMIAAIEAVL